MLAGRVTALYRYPLKGFSPQAFEAAPLLPGRGVPGDRVFAVENGPSGYDPAAPAFIAKQAFAVLFQFPSVAKVKTHLDEATGAFTATIGESGFSGQLEDQHDQRSFARWLTGHLSEPGRGELRVIRGADHGFTNNAQGFISVVNLASVADLGTRVGRQLDPLRFRANVYVDGWPAWAENEAGGRLVGLGTAQASVLKPIVRCAAIDVDPDSGEVEGGLTDALYRICGRPICGLYLTVTGKGDIARGDKIAIA